ncbi:MAG: cyclopropane-fatty-acyl-phospholipid synthase family protein [Actinomycetota bacterium]|nr:cyclopropane-fatty-acyl-phospholipid synthase family protein [Actinomycetota bacterium]
MAVADELARIIEAWLGTDLPVRIEAWDGSAAGPEDAATTLSFASPDALRRVLYAPNELGLARAYVAGDIDILGDVFGVFALRDAMASRADEVRLDLGWPLRWELLRTARRLGVLGRPLPPPAEEARLSGWRHSRSRDAHAVAHHYDVSNEFYRLILGETMTYSCAYFASPETTLDDAQRAKYEHICRKLGLRPGMRLLDVGCGWGGMPMHAAAEHGVTAVGITISRPQAEVAEKRVAEAGLADRVTIRLQDYRALDERPFDAISSIGMFEHVGLSQLRAYFTKLYGLLREGGRMLNHAISRPDPTKAAYEPNTFIARYVFPDGELHEVGSVVTEIQRLGFEVRDVESLREHYATTLRNWVTNLERGWEEAVRRVGAARARIWRLYMAGSAVAFEAGRINVHQVLAVKPDRDGTSGMPTTRAPWYAGPGI